jgi:hypothetical protein
MICFAATTTLTTKSHHNRGYLCRSDKVSGSLPLVKIIQSFDARLQVISQNIFLHRPQTLHQTLFLTKKRRTTEWPSSPVSKLPFPRFLSADKRMSGCQTQAHMNRKITNLSGVL